MPSAASAFAASTASDVPSPVVLHLPTAAITLRTDDPEVNFPRAAMQWTYVVRSRQRWATSQNAVERQADAATDLLQELGIDAAAQADIARAGMVGSPSSDAPAGGELEAAGS